MKDDFLPPVRRPDRQPEVDQDTSVPRQQPDDAKMPLVNPELQAVQPPPPGIAPAPEQSDDTASPLVKKPNRKKTLLWIVIGLLAFGIIMAISLVVWYQLALRPVATGAAKPVGVTIAKGSSPAQIGQLLEEKKVIRSQIAFDVYTRIHDVRGSLQAGTFSLSPDESTPQIVKQLTSSSSEEYSVTFYPGATLNIASTSADKTPSHRQVLLNLGFSVNEIDEAFAADYEHPLFADKPASADLEGYVYGQTYMIASGSSVKQILTRTFDEYYKQLQTHDLIAGFQKQGLNLYEGITLASIVQREVANKADQKQVAQVFFTRLNSGRMLGSDVTYHYAADKMGVPRSHTLDDPYNTRKYVGLPPGPIASPGLSALQAVANPASGDFVFFLSGDDGNTYFAHTNEEHEANIVEHCSFKCSLP
ncbi:MAG TPA: endolytic transglycosylase MltG [Candidatus Saccharimonadales bacterium]|nr:endolytic transglycosylase MltG [Candidatus Saccharimonadales bacterium]